MADKAGTPPRPPRVMRDAVSPGFGVLVCGMRTRLVIFGVDDVTGAGVRDGVIRDPDRNMLDAIFSIRDGSLTDGR